MKHTYVILELIPTASSPEKGDIIQLSALKIRDLELIDRFDYRLREEYIPLTDLIRMISYDKDKFIYKETSREIMNEFIEWIEDYDLLILNNNYTLNYLKDVRNLKKDIGTYLHLPYSDDIIDIIIEKYNLEPSNYIVDLLYEALIYESNNKTD